MGERWICTECKVSYRHRSSAALCHPNVVKIEDGDESTQQRLTTNGAEPAVCPVCYNREIYPRKCWYCDSTVTSLRAY